MDVCLPFSFIFHVYFGEFSGILVLWLKFGWRIDDVWLLKRFLTTGSRRADVVFDLVVVFSGDFRFGI